MTILLVEDDENKRQQITNAIAQLVSDATVVEARSLTSGRRKLDDATGWDLVILDMSIPAFDITRDESGGRPQALGGRDLLRHMRRRGLTVPVVVITQYDTFGEADQVLTLQELDERLRGQHGSPYRGVIVYNVVSDEWRTQLRALISELEGGAR